MHIGRGLLAAIGSCRRGDTLVVWKLDRVSRNLRELLAVLEALIPQGISLKVLNGAGAAIDLSQVEGAAIYTVYAAFAEMERQMNRARTVAGLEARKEKRPQSKRLHHYRRPSLCSVFNSRSARLGHISRTRI
ncbi:recombinase family protein [Aquibium oceanicum]|uniref:Resolvase/invertase-type recombinase catalytic domain-containing protein n=1 Tax=Aquibium oceanicum TaxID=1670800 RepID=A0A1L3SXS9_9HYPH|nr:recombinase family protein [Aquibium oceanicum]APH74171.1 hypothetical protein BSQ44_24460 [Aquibium oceanicum]